MKLPFEIGLLLMVGLGLAPGASVHRGGHTILHERATLSREIQQTLAKKYPRHDDVNWCSGKFLGRNTDAVAVLRNREDRKFLIVWVTKHGAIQELDSITQLSSTSFELQCLDAEHAAKLQATLQNSESIESSLQVPRGAGVVCYFTDKTTAKCWSIDSTSGRLIEVGGWQT